jgi:hypothetical protein
MPWVVAVVERPLLRLVVIVILLLQVVVQEIHLEPERVAQVELVVARREMGLMEPRERYLFFGKIKKLCLDKIKKICYNKKKKREK